MKIKNLTKKLGPGFITGASDDDPSGIGTYSQTGAQFGYSQSWMALFIFPFMFTIQEMCGRIGIVTGKGLALIIKKNYSRTIATIMVLLLVIANTINIGANLGAMAASANLILQLPALIWLIVFVSITVALEVLVTYSVYAKYLKYLAFIVIVYIITAFFVEQDWREIAWHTFVPSFTYDKDFLLNVVAILGTTISPYLFFWQSSEEVEELVKTHCLKTIDHGTPRISKKHLQEMRLDTFIGMFTSLLIMFFIIIVSAATLHAHGITDIQSADQAAKALEPFAGRFAALLFALGIIGTGLLSVPILAGSAAYGVTEIVNWKRGLNKKFSKAAGFYTIIALATLTGLCVNFTPIEPFKMLYYSAVINGVAAPPLMLLLLFITNNKKIMGRRTNSLLTNIIAGSITILMTAAAIALLISSS